MLVHFLPGQEEGNVDYVLGHGAGAQCEEPEEAVQTLSHWLADDRVKLREIAKKAEEAGKAEAAFTIAQAAWELMT
jgi:1,2-diacylglycerol 3-beta-galactosyltransferase